VGKVRLVSLILLFFFSLVLVGVAVPQMAHPEEGEDLPVILQEEPEVAIPEEPSPKDLPKAQAKIKEGYGPTWWEDAWHWYLDQGR